MTTCMKYNKIAEKIISNINDLLSTAEPPHSCPLIDKVIKTIRESTKTLSYINDTTTKEVVQNLDWIEIEGIRKINSSLREQNRDMRIALTNIRNKIVNGEI